jgi:NADH dehydrogenase FAD-containing subunit
MVKEITPEGVLCTRDGKELLIEADTVVCALGFRAPYDLTDQLCEACDESYIIGDCANVGKIYQAISGGYYTASRI